MIECKIIDVEFSKYGFLAVTRSYLQEQIKSKLLSSKSKIETPLDSKGGSY